MNPWILHECFNYDNYEEGYDHTFGVMSEGRPGLVDNPGDEGNLVQSAEIIKAMDMVAGVETVAPGKIRLMPRIPWTWDEIRIKDFPVEAKTEIRGRIEMHMAHERWLRKSYISVKSSVPLKQIDVRIGPYPSYIKIKNDDSLTIEKSLGGTWVWLHGITGLKLEREIILEE